MLNKKEQRLRRSRQTRARILEQRQVRLSVFRSNLHIYASVVSEDGQRVIASASTAKPIVHLCPRVLQSSARISGFETSSRCHELVLR